MDEIIRLDTVEDYCNLFGLEMMNPLVGVIDLRNATRHPVSFTVHYGVYAIFLKDTKCGDIRYGRLPYDYREGTVVSFAPGQVAETEMLEGMKPTARGLLFHPDIIKGTPLEREMRTYSFFSYDSTEALHLSGQEKTTFVDCLDKIKTELMRPVDRLTNRIMARIIQLLLDYCMRFYNRQFATRKDVNKGVMERFEALLDDYYHSDGPLLDGLPSVKYFADKVCLSPNYFGDLVRKETGKTAQECIQDKVMAMAKEKLIGSDKTVSQIAYELGYQYSQHFNRMFKRAVGMSPSEYRRQEW